MRVHVVDPAAYTPPYDHALCAALARAGADVDLWTTRFAHGAAPAPAGYRRIEAFYGGAQGRAARALRHVPDMLHYRRRAAAADVVHFQWLPLQYVDWALMPRRATVLTAHDVLPREASPGQRAAQKRIYARVDAVVVHSEHGARRLREEAGVQPARIHVIAHGAFAPHPAGALPRGLVKGERPVVLFFGLIRPYKGLDVLLEAWRSVTGADLWVVGMPRMEVPRAAGVSYVTRFVSDAEAAAVMEAADVVVLPYLEIDQSGVLFLAMGHGKAMVLSDVGGFPEVACAEHVPAGDARALAATLQRLADSPQRRAELAAAAREAAATAHSWDAIAARHLELYAKTM